MKNIFNLMKIRTRLLLLAVLTGLAIVVVVALSVFSLNGLANNLTQINTSLLPSVDNIKTVRYRLARIDEQFNRADHVIVEHVRVEEAWLSEIDFLSEDNSERAKERISEVERKISMNQESLIEQVREFERVIEQIEEEINMIIPLFQVELTSEASMGLFANFSETYELYKELRELAFVLFFEGEADEAAEAYQQAVNTSIETAQTLQELVDFTVEASDSVSNSGVELANTSIQLLVILSVMISVVISVILIFITNSITKPINLLASELSQVANGDLTIEVPTNFKAEFGEMFENFKKMLGNLKGLMTNAQTTSTDIHEVFGTVKGTIDELHENIKVIDGHIYAVVGGVESQMASLKESSAAMDSIANGVSQIAASSTSVAELATETSTQANDGSAVIEKSVAQMETINQVVEDTSGVVDRLVKRTKTIDEALKAITAIAEQTNLLALNASIEAARAGEQGRGFAVVAEEVSKLADQSKASANEINTLLQEINGDTTEAVQAMEKGKLESKQGIEIIQQAGQAFKNIVEQVTAMTEQVQEVSSTVEELASGTEEVNASLADVVQTSEDIPKQANKMVKHSEIEDEILDRLFTAINTTQNSADTLDGELIKFKTEKSESK